MRRLLLSVLVTACASAPVERQAVEEVLGVAKQPLPTEPVAAADLLERLQRFVETSEATRKSVPRGAPMPTRAIDGWTTTLNEVTAFTQRPSTTALDLVRARLWLQTALETDGSHYGDVPSELASNAQRTIASLSTRLLALTPSRRFKAKANPATFWWPVDPVVVTSPWGDRLHPLRGEYHFHSGIDLEAAKAQPIYAVSDGVVTFSGWNSGHGKQVELQHDAHVSTRYSHLSALAVQGGDLVKRGDVIGWAGRTGTATGVHLHFELRRDGESLDPESELPAPSERVMVSR